MTPTKNIARAHGTERGLLQKRKEILKGGKGEEASSDNLKNLAFYSEVIHSGYYQRHLPIIDLHGQVGSAASCISHYERGRVGNELGKSLLKPSLHSL